MQPVLIFPQNNVMPTLWSIEGHRNQGLNFWVWIIIVVNIYLETKIAWHWWCCFAELVSCDKVDQGCEGGLPSDAYKQIIKLGGICKEYILPFPNFVSKAGFFIITDWRGHQDSSFQHFSPLLKVIISCVYSLRPQTLPRFAVKSKRDWYWNDS